MRCCKPRLLELVGQLLGFFVAPACLWDARVRGEKRLDFSEPSSKKMSTTAL
jgi:hypothetical protein